MNYNLMRKIKSFVSRSVNILLSVIFCFSLRHFIKANNEFDAFFHEIISKFNLKTVKLGYLTSVLIGKDFAIIINTLHEDRAVLYVYRDNITGKLLVIDCYLYLLEKAFIEIRKEVYKVVPARVVDNKIVEIEETLYHPSETFDSTNFVIDGILANFDKRNHQDISNGKSNLFLIKKSLEYSNDLLEGDTKWIKDYKESIWSKDIEKLEWKYKIILNKHIKF